MESWSFPRAIAHQPYIILATIFLFSSMCLIIPFTTKKLPDFSDPRIGFEARGTMLAQRLTAWHNLMEATKATGELIDNPLEYQQYVLQDKTLRQHPSINMQKNYSLHTHSILRKKPKNKHKQDKKLQVSLNGTNHKNNKNKNTSEKLKNKYDVNITDYKKEHTHIQKYLDSDDFFCNSPISSYARVVIGTDAEENLWSIEGVLAQCHIDDVLRANIHFSSLCQTHVEYNIANQKCCRSWSPANYVALLSNRSSCLEVTENDLSRVKMLLEQCAYYYHNHKLSANCAEDFNCQGHVPPECYVKNAVYHLLHYLLDVSFIPNHKTETKNKQSLTLQSAMLFLPIAASSATLDFFKEIENNDLTYGKFHVQGIQLGLKSTLFDRLLISDSSLLLAGFVFVILSILIYTGSIILTITTIFTVIFSLGISYAVYTLVCNFFPFMNLLAVVVAIGIGADDAFIYYKIWESEKQFMQRNTFSNGRLTHLVQKTMKHAFPSMFVTSLTTAVAFFASIISNVTAINCFSLFSGMTVIANFFLMITWLPACVVISEYCKLTTLPPVNYITKKIIHPLRSFGYKVTIISTTLLTKIVISLRYLWILSLGSIAIMCCIIVFRYPGLQLPDYIDFQLFDKTHPFEQYDLIYSRKFWFERHEMVGTNTSTAAEIMPLRFVWGIQPIDNGDYLDPNRKGTLDYDETFDLASPNSQLWLEQFCRNLRNQPFYRNTMGPLLTNCFIESLRSWMQRPCKDPIDPLIDYVPCCESSKFPYKRDVFQQCAAEITAKLHHTPSYLWIREGSSAISAGLKFIKPLSSQTLSNSHTLNNTNLPVKLIPKIKALIVEYDSLYAYTLSYANMDQFFYQVENWMQDQLKNAPPGMQRGWFISTFEFYELQRTLYEGTIWAMGMSLSLALIVLVFVTFNPLVSLYAILTIGAAITVTVALFILLGWKLNVLESVAVSTAIGLAVDFSLHYAVSYKACISDKKIDKVKAALQQMGGPTFMAAITSGVAGALMLPSHVLAYIQIATFLVVLMSTSWIFATFFLCPILAIIGPSSHFAQFNYPRLKKLLICFRKCEDDSTIEVDKDDNQIKETYNAQEMLSESTLNTTSTVYQFDCSELENLAARSASPSLPPSSLSTLLH